MNLPLEDCDYFVRVIPFGVPVPAFIRENPDCITYTLYFNSEYDFEHWLNSYEHEMMHLVRGDFDGEKDIRDIEFKKGA